MFVSARRKTAGEHRTTTTLWATEENPQPLNHWAWTGWMPEAEYEEHQPAVQVKDDYPMLMAA